MGFSSKLGRAIKDPRRVIRKTYEKVDESAGKKLFGNTVGLSRNVLGQFSQNLNKKNIGKTSFLAEKLLDKQYLTVGKPFDALLMNKIKERYDKMIRDNNYSFVVSEYEGKEYQRFIKFAIKNIPELKKLLTDEIVDIIEGYYGSHFKVIRVSCWRNYHIPTEIEDKNELFSNKWHCDKRSTKLLKLFVNLSDITEKDGPFHVQSKQQTKELMQKGFNSRADYNIPTDVLEDPQHVVKAIGKSGSVFFSNTQFCLHKAGNPDEGKYRDMIQWIFEPSRKPLEENWEEDVESDDILQNMLKKE